VLAEIERRNLLSQVRDRGALLEELLHGLIDRHPNLLVESRGWGLLQGLVLREGGPSAPEVVKAAMDLGLLLVSAGPNVVRVVPPLVIKPKQLRKLVERLELALQSLA
jgi:acetylornithine aminotransferase